ncbi:MAG: hypothetical protein IKO87_00085 [Kiritimatiellae bacterium]|nr:hypothetical protein [Kiritimatiellia bacterium]
MPLPYTIDSAQLDDEAWIATMSGLDTFINGVGDIKIGIKAYSRSGN